MKFQFTPLREGRRGCAPAGHPAGQFQFTPLREGRRARRDRTQHRRQISIHAPPRGATRRATTAVLGAGFQFTPLREGRRSFKLYQRKEAYFNSRPSARGDAFYASIENQFANFNSRPSARGDFPVVHCSSPHVFQFTPLREGRPCRSTAYAPCSIISIHAPPRGATDILSIGGDTDDYFNSRPSARGDPSPPAALYRTGISIHAPPRGATRMAAMLRGAMQFQFTPLREGRLCADGTAATTARFQFTPLREGRPTHQREQSCPSTPFQFTPLREGRRQKICNFCKSFVQPLQISMA